MNTRRLFMTAMLLALAPTVGANTEREWRFKVYLDEQEIGYHRFQVRDQGDSRIVHSDAQFDVKFLFFTAYRYDHRNREHWHDGCLRAIRANTDDNGTTYAVRGESVGDRFLVAAGPQTAELPSCVRTFAYWDLSLLQHSRLLNAQTGEYIDVAIEHLGREAVRVGSVDVPARAYHLRAENFDIKLWYSLDDRWLALDSTTAEGRQIRYRLTEVLP